MILTLIADAATVAALGTVMAFVVAYPISLWIKAGKR